MLNVVLLFTNGVGEDSKNIDSVYMLNLVVHVGCGYSC